MVEDDNPSGFKRLEMTRGFETSAEGSVWPLLLEPVVQRRRHIALAVLASAAVAASVFWILPNRYISTARILPESDQSGSYGMPSRYGVGLLEAAGLSGRDLGKDESALYLEILRSDFVKDDVLEHLYEISAVAPHPFSLYNYLDVDTRERAYEKLGEVVKVAKDNRTGIVSVSAETTHPELSARVATQVLSALSRYNATQRRTTLAEVEHFLAGILESSHDELLAAEDRLAEFQSRNRNYAVTDDPDLERDLGRLTRDVELKSATYMTLNQQYLLAKIETQKEVPSFQILDRPRPATVKSGPRRIRGTLAAALATALLLVGGLMAWRWLKLLVRPQDAARLKSMTHEVTADITRAVSRVRHLSHHVRS